MRRARVRRRRGFTLIELMISLTAGLLISSAAFILARNASRFFAKEAGITTAQFANVVAMTRLTSDLKRSAYAATPNVEDEDWLCGDTALWPAGMQNLTGLRIIENGSAVAHAGDHALSVANGLEPDAVEITGAFATTEIFSVSHIVAAGGATTVFLQNDAPMIRTMLASQGSIASRMGETFVPGRMVRIIEKDEGRMMFGVIQAVTVPGGVTPSPASPKISLTLTAAPAIPTVRAPGDCGCIGLCTGAVINPVSRVRYDLRRINPLANPGYAALYSNALHSVASFHRGLSEATRTDLVRVEVGTDGNEIAGTLELVAEYAVDLKFGLTFENPTVPPAAPTAFERRPLGHPDVYQIASAVAGGGAGRPQDIRAVQVRLSTRAADRDRDVDLAPINTDAGRLRYSLGADRGFARMRTLISEVALMNHPRD